MSVKSDAAAQLLEHADALLKAQEGWPNRQSLEPARAAVDECVAILRDASSELVATGERTRA